MAAGTPDKPIKTGLSLYANLLDPAASGTISKAPVIFKQSQSEEQQDESSAQKQQISAAALRFQPTKRPQIAAQKSKPKASIPKATLPTTATAPQAAPTQNSNVIKPLAKTSLADWTADGEDDDVNGFYGGEKRQRGGRKKRKKNKEESHLPQNWDDIYDPSRPNSYEEYKGSDEQIREVREWKDRLYAHRMARRQKQRDYSDSDDDSGSRPQMRNQFAPPAQMSFAPPATGDDAYARRLRLSGINPEEPQYPKAPDTLPLLPLPPPPLESEFPYQSQLLPPPPPSRPPATISKAPVRYNLPAAPEEIPRSEAELASALREEEDFDIEEQDDSLLNDENSQRSRRPGQQGFAQRLMSKYGWTKGSGLGADGSGIVNPLRVQVEKQKKKPDSEGGGFVGPGGMGKILGGKKKGGADGQGEGGKFGSMSEVVILRGMVDGMDLDAEMEAAGDGGLMQEIGEECSEKASIAVPHLRIARLT
ncbi:MAG: hypothetical protein MMC33_003670 [Icmadophila ericetorum]|nr:hypothetical protein [Icmadophila ericetorum]